MSLKRPPWSWLWEAPDVLRAFHIFKQITRHRVNDWFIGLPNSCLAFIMPWDPWETSISKIKERRVYILLEFNLAHVARYRYKNCNFKLKFPESRFAINKLKYVFLYSVGSRGRREIVPVLTADLKLLVIRGVIPCWNVSSLRRSIETGPPEENWAFQIESRY